MFHATTPFEVKDFKSENKDLDRNEIDVCFFFRWFDGIEFKAQTHTILHSNHSQFLLCFFFFIRTT